MFKIFPGNNLIIYSSPFVFIRKERSQWIFKPNNPHRTASFIMA